MIDNGLLPEGWRWTKLEECAKILDNKRVPINADERGKRIIGKDMSELFPYYGATGKVGWIDSYIYDGEILLLGEDGAPFLDADKDKAYIVKGKSWVKNHAHVLNARSDTTSNLYLMHYLNSFDYHGFVTGTTRLKLNQEQMRKFPVILPPLPEQERIVAKIEALFTQLDAGTAALGRIQAELKRYKASVLEAACEGRLVAQDTSDEPAEELLRRMGKVIINDGENLPTIPIGWVLTEWEQLVSYSQNGFGKRKSDNGTPTIVLRLADIIKNTISFESIRRIKASNEEIGKYKLLLNDLLCVRVNGSLDNVGRMVLFQEQPEPIIFCDHFIKFRMIEPEMAPFYSLYFNTSRARKFVELNRVSSAGQNTISQGTLNRFIVPLPPLSEQKRIINEVERRLSVVKEVDMAVEAALARSARLRQAILKRAFEGRLIEHSGEVAAMSAFSSDQSSIESNLKQARLF